MSRNQISGAVSLDVSGVAEAVRDELRPVFDDLRNSLGLIVSMVAPVVLSKSELSDALAVAGSANPDELAHRLTLAGYALMVNQPGSSPEPVTAEPATTGGFFTPERAR